MCQAPRRTATRSQSSRKHSAGERPLRFERRAWRSRRAHSVRWITKAIAHFTRWPAIHHRTLAASAWRAHATHPAHGTAFAHSARAAATAHKLPRLRLLVGVEDSDRVPLIRASLFHRTIEIHAHPLAELPTCDGIRGLRETHTRGIHRRA